MCSASGSSFGCPLGDSFGALSGVADLTACGDQAHLCSILLSCLRSTSLPEKTPYLRSDSEPLTRDTRRLGAVRFIIMASSSSLPELARPVEIGLRGAVVTAWQDRACSTTACRQAEREPLLRSEAGLLCVSFASDAFPTQGARKARWLGRRAESLSPTLTRPVQSRHQSYDSWPPSGAARQAFPALAGLRQQRTVLTVSRDWMSLVKTWDNGTRMHGYHSCVRPSASTQFANAMSLVGCLAGTAIFSGHATLQC